MFRVVLCLLLGTSAALCGQDAVDLPAMVVYSPRIANQDPVATFATPVSALRYEPEVDVQARNMAEGQADITIRGSTFENTGFTVGGVTILDPQTGHYLAELPVPPLMLGAPQVLTGVGNTLASMNVNVGSIAYAWRPVKSGGLVSVAGGQYDLNREELYLAQVRPVGNAGATVGTDVAYARSASEGSVPYGDHHFERVGGRLQFHTPHAQTDLFAGYQAKFFGWPNLYTPYGVDESENLQTLLLMLSQWIERPEGGYLNASAYYRRNKDDYEFNRLKPGLYNPYQHTTRVHGAAVSGREVRGDWAMRYRAEVSADNLESTSLTAGRYHTRTIGKVALAGEHHWAVASAGEWQTAAGVSYDETNRDGGTWSPLVEVSRVFPAGQLWRAVTLSYARSTQVASYTALNSSPTAGLFRGNPNLGRESSRNLELAAVAQVAGWHVQGAAFNRWDDSLVDWTYASNVYARTANAVDIVTSGLEVMGRRDFGQGSVTLGYTVLTKKADYGAAYVEASFYALNYARHRLTAAFTVHLGEDWELRMDNEARIQAKNALRTTGGNEALLSSLSLLWRPPAWRGAEVALQVDNLWNSPFQDVPAVPAARRQVALSLAYGW